MAAVRLERESACAIRPGYPTIANKNGEPQFPVSHATPDAAYLYAAGSPLFVGFANSFLSGAATGTLRLTFFGGMADRNHLV